MPNVRTFPEKEDTEIRKPQKASDKEKEYWNNVIDICEDRFDNFLKSKEQKEKEKEIEKIEKIKVIKYKKIGEDKND